MNAITDATNENEAAKKILFDTYWSSSGWKRKSHTSPSDFEFACKAGYMFKPEDVDHDKVIAWAKEAKQNTDLLAVSNAFLASLSSRKLEYRSALGSVAVLKHFPIHDAPLARKEACQVCGYSRAAAKEDLSVLNFERHKWAGVRHSDVLYAAFDLKLFSELQEVEPTPEDIGIMREILRVLKSAQADDSPRTMEKSLADVLSSNKQEREVLLTILSFCGILQPEGRSGYFDTFINRAFSDHTDNLPPAYKLDWQYPLCWWRGKDGVDDRAVKHYFPQLG